VKIDELKGWYEWPSKQRAICFLCETRHNCRAMYRDPSGIVWEMVEWLCPTCLEIWRQENYELRVARELMG